METSTERRKHQIEEFVQLENKVDNLSTKVDEVVIKLSSEHASHHDYIEKAMKREARKEAFHQAIIEKTITSLLWSAIVGLGYLVWQGITAHWKW